MKERDRFDRDRLLKYKEQSTSYIFYAIQRIDLLIISISGAGIYIIFQTLRFIKEQGMNLDLFWLKTGGVMFTLAIIVNFFSQWAGYKANKFEEDWAEQKIKEKLGKTIDQTALEKTSNNGMKYTNLTTTLNIVSTCSMLIGIVILVIFNFSTF